MLLWLFGLVHEMPFLSQLLLGVGLRCCEGAGWFCESVAFGEVVTPGCGEQGTSLSWAVAQGWLSTGTKRVPGPGGLVGVELGRAF